MSDSPVVNKVEELLQKTKYIMQPDEFAQHQKIIMRFERAKQLKQQRYKYYDGMTYDEDYASNEDLKNTFLTPKANETEVRVNTGTSEKKLDAIKNELATMNIGFEIKAHDRNDLEIEQLGNDIGDIVTRTNRMEKEEDLLEEATDELLSQRVTYIKETYQPVTLMRGKETIEIAKKELLSGLKVFPGDWTIPAYLWDTQPYVVEYDRIPYEQAQSVFGHYANFEHVLPNQAARTEYLGGAFAYRFGELQDGEVEILTYYSLPDNEHQIYINGVPMEQPGKTLPWSYPRYNIRAYTTKSMSRNFLAGRPVTAMAKTMQGLSNEMIRLFIRKTQQSLEPPRATPKGGKIYSKNIYNPGAWTQGLRKDDITSLIDHQGVTQGEMAMFKIVEDEVEKFIGTPNIAQGLQGSREMSATEVLTLTKQFLKQLGYTVAALMRMRRDLTEMRIYTVLENYLEPTKRRYDPLTKKVEDIYRSFTLDNTTFSNGRKGKKVIKLMPRDLTPNEEEQIYNFEEEQEKQGKLVRIRTINAKKLKEIPVMWYVSTFVQDKEGTALDKVTFQDQLSQATLITQVTGKPMNPDIVTQEFERKWKAKDWFNVPAPELTQTNPAEDPNQVKQDASKLLQEMEGTTGAQVSRGLRGASTSANQNIAAQEMMAS